MQSNTDMNGYQLRLISQSIFGCSGDMDRTKWRYRICGEHNVMGIWLWATPNNPVKYIIYWLGFCDIIHIMATKLYDWTMAYSLC